MVREICKVFTIAQHAASPVHLFPSFTTPGKDVGCGEACKEVRGWVATRDINVQKLESQFTPHTLAEFSSGSLLHSVSSSLFLCFSRRCSTAVESTSPGIPRAFRINKASEARTPKALKHEKARSAGWISIFLFSFSFSSSFSFFSFLPCERTDASTILTRCYPAYLARFGSQT